MRWKCDWKEEGEKENKWIIRKISFMWSSLQISMNLGWRKELTLTEKEKKLAKNISQKKLRNVELSGKTKNKYLGLTLKTFF